jgi:acyl-CoA thioesterase-2
MNPLLADLIRLLELEPIERNIFRGQSRDTGAPQVYGGQVLGQALAAASQTVTGRSVHSLHAYFLQRGDVNAPIVYEVDRARDGGSFTSRRVVAIQHGAQIFNMAASFQVLESGLEHQFPMPAVPPPESLKDVATLARENAEDLPPRLQRFLTRQRPFDIRPADPSLILAREEHQPYKYAWMRSVEKLPDDPFLHQVLLAYISDYELLSTATLPHGRHPGRERLQMASLDHAMWFHRPCRVDEWLLFALDSPAAAGARGLARGLVYTQDGRLAASMAQEGLIRLRRPPDAGG